MDVCQEHIPYLRPLVHQHVFHVTMESRLHRALCMLARANVKRKMPANPRTHALHCADQVNIKRPELMISSPSVVASCASLESMAMPWLCMPLAHRVQLPRKPQPLVCKFVKDAAQDFILPKLDSLYVCHVQLVLQPIMHVRHVQAVRVHQHASDMALSLLIDFCSSNACSWLL